MSVLVFVCRIFIFLKSYNWYATGSSHPVSSKKESTAHSAHGESMRGEQASYSVRKRKCAAEQSLREAYE